MLNRSLETLGLATVPAKEPLSYPGRPITAPSLLDDGSLLELTVGHGPVETWEVLTEQGPVPLDAHLAVRGAAPLRERHAAVSVGSNASPAQLNNKLVSRGLQGTVPMVPVRAYGLAIGMCAHIYPAGYVATAPYADKRSELTLVTTWLDDDQLKAVDETEIPFYERVLLPGDAFPMRLPHGEMLKEVHLYTSAMGVLAGPGGTPRPAQAEQAALLEDLLAASAPLRAILGPDPLTWVERASTQPELREKGTRIFQEEGWVLMVDDFTQYAVGHS
ncbi:hypothetical protein [Streptomyces sp. NPDC058092]|uniref:hypothetical protein n=1 Tax=Streptomyces sp. NPDC058092 TaxID=3346336 RepID=UPI0036EB85AC